MRHSQSSMGRELCGVSNWMTQFKHSPYYWYIIGVEVTSTGNPGHGSAFIKDTAMEKLVSE